MEGKVNVFNVDPVITVNRLRKGVGILGISLPIVIVLLSLIPFFETDIQISLSAYYYTNLREIFTSVLCAVGFFLLLYKSDIKDPKLHRKENILVNIMGVTAIGVAFIPTKCRDYYFIGGTKCENAFSFIPHAGDTTAMFHAIIAAILFLTFAYTSYFIFTKEDPNVKPGEVKIYKGSAIVILLSTITILIDSIIEFFSHTTLICEALLLFGFGISWLVKGKPVSEKFTLFKGLYK